jgi:indole-3-glycerol phosphate synthase
MPSLDRLISSSRRAVEERRAARPLSELEQAVADLDPIRPFTEAVVGEEISFVLRCPSDPDLLRTAAEAGVAGLFARSDEELANAAEASELPLLNHGLLVDPYQLYETRVIGGDGVVLLAAAFEDEDERLASMHGIALELGLDVVVEVASEHEIDAAMELVDPDSFLIRNRDSENGAAELERTFSLLEEVPAGKAVLSQGGIRSREHAAALESVGVDAAVIGRWIYAGELARTLDVLRGDSRD